MPRLPAGLLTRLRQLLGGLVEGLGGLLLGLTLAGLVALAALLLGLLHGILGLLAVVGGLLGLARLLTLAGLVRLLRQPVDVLRQFAGLLLQRLLLRLLLRTLGGGVVRLRIEPARFQELTGKLYRAGVPILVGTDSPEPQVTPGVSLHQELALLVESGLPPVAVLQAVTLRNAAVLREEDRLGSISAGKWADMVLLTANPLKDIRNSRSIELVIRSGKVCRPAELLKLVPK